MQGIHAAIFLVTRKKKQKVVKVCYIHTYPPLNWGEGIPRPARGVALDATPLRFVANSERTAGCSAVNLAHGASFKLIF